MHLSQQHAMFVHMHYAYTSIVSIIHYSIIYYVCVTIEADNRMK